jgi:tRNA(Leu) C34 or U34 (ribose-2'-O)-methylase TrmL
MFVPVELNMENPMVNYAKIITETNSKMFNVRDEYKDNTVEHNQSICKADRLPFSVGVINVAGDLNVGMMLRSACLLGAENFYIFGRKKFDKRSTVGAENYINIKQIVFDDPIHADVELLHYLNKLHVHKHNIIICEQGGHELGTSEWSERLRILSSSERHTPLFLFGSESHGVPEMITDTTHFPKVSIPQRGVLRSFNVSAACNIIIWDYCREMFL